jgi:hypothetical protein
MKRKEMIELLGKAIDGDDLIIIANAIRQTNKKKKKK